MDNRIFVNSFGVEILSKNLTTGFKKNDGYYVGLKSGSEYKLELINNRPTICDVDINIDGEFIGKWRIQEFSVIVLERPLSAKRKFTFFSEDSGEARKAGVIIGNPDAGVIKAIFTPKKLIPIAFSYNRAKSASKPQNFSLSNKSLNNYKTGVTVLGNNSDQEFINVEPINPKDIDRENITEIIIRLIAEKEYIQIPSLRLSPRRTSYPPRIDDIIVENEPVEPPVDYFS